MLLRPVWILALVFAVEAWAEIDHEFSGRINLESRWFPEAGAHPGQRAHASGFVAVPKLYLEDAAGRSLTLAPFFRYDNTDSRRTHADLREAYLLLFGAIGAGEWELRVGVDQVFWGVTESQHLVDIVNQVDLVEHPAGEAKLGQPMVYLTWSSDWGVMEILGLPYHRARTFPGQAGRLRLPLVVEAEQVEYESEAKERHVDFAARYSHSFGLLDMGVSAFNGTSREPALKLLLDPNGAPTLGQYYAQIRQFGLDAQLTVGSWLFKLEAIQRTGARNLSAGKRITLLPFWAASTRSIPYLARLPISACSANGITTGAAAMRPQAARPVRSKMISSSPLALRSTTFRAVKLSLVCWGMWTVLPAHWPSHWSGASLSGGPRT